MRSYMSEKYFHAERFVIPEGCTEGVSGLKKIILETKKIAEKDSSTSMVMIMAWSMVVLHQGAGWYQLAEYCQLWVERKEMMRACWGYR